ncbi:hypothetical protein [Synechococcus sp. CCAP 1479/9]|uniref:hypothetical protein n=1 Tax=Synechococcus sp. CCAP 1479/9 TaxID=1221593 RepID=UPI001C23BF64|nr:hypothetical protein [Synechococcus sp. CCAP 1479/9]
MLVFSFGASIFFFAAVTTGKWRGYLLFFTLFIALSISGEAGVKNAPLGRNARLLANDLIEKSNQNPENGKAVADQIDGLLRRESNWFGDIWLSDYEYELERARNNSIASYKKYIADIKTQTDRPITGQAQEDNTAINRAKARMMGAVLEKQAEKGCYRDESTGELKGSWNC